MEKSSTDSEPEFLKVIDVAKILNVSRMLVYSLMDRGVLDSVRLGKARRVRRQILEDFIAASTVNRIDKGSVSITLPPDEVVKHPASE